MKLTPWFSVRKKPVRVGVYERDHQDGCPICFQHWNGEWWSLAAEAPGTANGWQHFKSTCQYGKWRGLTKPTKGAK